MINKTYIIFYICMVCLFKVDANENQRGDKNISEMKSFLIEAPLKIKNFTFGKIELKKCAKYAKLTKKSARLPYLLIMARYYRINEGKPNKSIHLIGDYVLEEKQLQTWYIRNAVAEEKAIKKYEVELKKWESDIKYARLKKNPEPLEPNEPSGIFAPLPTVSDWKINKDNVEAAIELVYCMIDSGQLEDSLVAIKKIGVKFDDEGRVLSAECAADVFNHMRLFDKSIEYYRYSLKYLERLKKDDLDNWDEKTDNHRRFYTPEQKVIKKRIIFKLNKTKALRDTEKYGPDWVAYRKAETLRKERKSFIEAFCVFHKITNKYKNTVYSDAAKCYMIKCLLKLIDKDNIANSQVIIQALLDEKKSLNSKYLSAKKSKVKRYILNNIEEDIKAIELKLQELSKVPTGNKAKKEAINLAEEFMKESEWGLYRGEILVDIANYYLEYELDANNSLKYYLKAKTWFEKIQDIDKKLEVFSLPGCVKKVATPPKSERYIDSWNNYHYSAIKPGEVFNRRTTDWYLSHFHKNIVLYLGLLSYLDKDYETAKKHWDELLTLDPFYNKLHASGWGSVYTRLIASIKKNPGCIYATKEQMSSFRDRKKKLAVYLGDISYVNEHPKTALNFYRRILDGECGRLSKNERAYAIFGIFACYCWDTSISEIEYINNNMRKIKGTTSESRILFGYANRLSTIDTEEALKESENIYKLLMKKYPKSIEGRNAIFFLGCLYKYLGDSDNAQVLLSKYLKNKRNIEYREVALKYLDDLK